SSFS
ncbi:hypothetical protein D043_0457B, partial [Vibrio parahaemolyticus EKP-021]